MSHRICSFVAGLGPIALLLLVGGCADSQMYKGDRLSAGQVARIESDSIQAIDGKDWDAVRSRNWRNWVTFPTGYADVLPGRHELDVEAKWNSKMPGTGYKETRELAFTAEPGHQYAIRKRQSPAQPPPEPLPQIVFGSPFGLLSVPAPLDMSPPPPPRYQLDVWVEDTGTRQPVAGTVPSP